MKFDIEENKIKLPKDIFNLKEDSSHKKKKNKNKKSSEKDHGNYVFMYSNFLSAIMAASYDETDIKIPRYDMKRGQYAIIEKAGSMKLSKVKYASFSVNETSLNALMNNKYVKKKARVQNRDCIYGTEYTVIKFKIPDLIDIINYSVSISSDKGNEITKIINNLCGVHDVQLFGKDKKLIGNIIRG